MIGKNRTMSRPMPRHDRPQPARTRLLRGLTRACVKPLFHPRVPVSVKRRGLRLAAQIARPARGSRIRRIAIAEVPVEEVTCGDTADTAVVYCHGGAYCVGSPATHHAITSRLARSAGAHVLAVDYRLAPEHPFPAAVDDALAVYRHLLQELGPQRVALAGDSAGGGLALATALAARAEGLDAPAALWLISPWVDLTLSNAGRPAPPDCMLNWPGLAHAARLYAPDAAENPLASPLLGDLAGLPPMLIQAGSDEILLAEARQLAEKARTAGVDVRLDVFDGLWHVFHAHAGTLAAARLAVADGAEFLRKGVES